MIKIKLCGLSRRSDIQFANRLKPDYIGFVFVQKSKSYVDEEKALELKRILDNDISAVGVFVDEQPEKICRLASHRIVDVIQLHGSEDNSYICNLKEKTGSTVIKAFQINEKTDLDVINSSLADYVLLDSGAGSGSIFDWSILKDIKRPYFLAGGLTPQNVRRAIEKYHPYAVDASSSLETEGYKDWTKMEAFIREIRG